MFLAPDNTQALALPGRNAIAFFRHSLILLCLTVFSCLSFPVIGAQSSSPTLTASTINSADGTFTLSWTSSASPVQLQQAIGDGQFQTLYQGNDNASVITGLADGSYRYRIRQQLGDGAASAWSPAIEITVAHHPLSRALGFFAVGVIVFVATLLMILIGSRHHPTGRMS